MCLSPGVAHLLASDESPAWTVDNPHGTGHAVVVCDHATNRIPRRLNWLGLGAATLASHIAWDPGALQVAHRLAQLLDATLVASGYSRLVIDCNRPLGSDELIAASSAGVVIPGNQGIDARQRQLRISELFAPYHRAIADVLDHRAAAGRPSLILSIHSFTPVLNGERRPWEVGFAYGSDSRLALRLIEVAQTGGQHVIGHNQPYSVETAYDHTVPVHGEQRGLPHVLVEIRQDLLTTTGACAAWAAWLAAVYQESEPLFVA